MAITLQQLIDLACEQAGVVDEIRAEALTITAFDNLAHLIAADPERRHSLIHAVTISLTNGVGTLPDTVMLDYMCDATLENPDDATEEYSYVPYWDDYRRTSDRRLGYFINRQTAFNVTQPGVAYTAGSGRTGDVTLTVSTMPVTPTLATDAIANLPTELEPDLVSLLAGLLKGGK